MSARRPTSTPVMVPAKISVPRSVETYPRKRLFRVLDAARRKKVVWVAAPAGAGKTSVVATYLSARRLPALWYNVDARDADVAHLFHYLALAVRAASPRKKKFDLPTFTAASLGGVAAFARGFFEAVCRERPAPSLIVLDDFQEAREKLWNDVIREAIGALPKGIVIVVISRTEPPAAFARNVASGEIAVVGWDELRLTQAETTGLVRLCRPDWRGQKLREVLPGIATLANGWAAALMLLLQNQHVGDLDPDGVEASSERLFGYFATEILDKTTPLQRDFLLRTSVVPSLTTKLAVRLTDAPDPARVLNELGHRSFLTHRLGASGAHRYHPLLREFLLRRAEHDLGADVLNELHRRAAEYFIEMHLIDEAMEQLEKASEVPIRTELLLRVAPSHVAKGRGRTVEEWIARLPAEVVAQRGWLMYWRAVCCLGHSPGRARELLEGVFARFGEEGDAGGLYLSCSTAMQAIIHEGMDFGRLVAWVARLERLQASGPPCPETVEPMAAAGMLMASMFGPGDPLRHRYWADRALYLSASCRDIGHRVMAGGFLAVNFIFNDNPAKAATILEMLRTSARTESSTIASLTLLQADALCAWVRGDSATCIAFVRDALALAARTGVFVWSDYLLGLGTAATLGGDDVESAREFLDGLAQIAQRGSNYALGSYHFYAAWDASLRGDAERALRSAKLSFDISSTLAYPFGRAMCSLIVALMCWQTGRRREAEEMQQIAREIVERENCFLVLYACELIEADAFWGEDRPRALAALERGLALGRECGFFNAFLIGTGMMARLAARALEHNIEPDFVRSIIVKRKLALASVPASTEGWHWAYRFRVLGNFELARAADDGKANGGTRHAADGALRGMPLRLLQAALVFGGKGVAEVQLIDALWPHAEGDGGRRVFDTTLHRLRRQLGDDAALRLSDGRLYVDERLCWIDVWAFDETFAKVKAMVVDHASKAELETLTDQLLGLYRGPLLADDTGASDFLPSRRRKLAARFVFAADKIGKAIEKKGGFDQAAALYQRVIEGDQGLDLAYAGLIRCAAGVGRHADALQLFDQCHARMMSDFGEEPGPELKRLRAQLTRLPGVLASAPKRDR